VQIEPGLQKYVLILVQDPNTGISKYLVRGLCSAAFHADIAKPAMETFFAQG
jgi:hypothetical protein